MNLQDLPENQRVVGVENGNIRVAATRISPKMAIVVWELPHSNEEVLRTRVDVFTGETVLESFSTAFWQITMDGAPKSAAELNRFVGKAVAMNANPAERSLTVTTLVHHYTSINTLALILKHRTIRFNRLDRVDDLTEAQSFPSVKLANYLFVSCWTDSAIESIPQWHMYSNGMAGVRLTLPKSFFAFGVLKPPASSQGLVKGEIFSPIPFERLFTDDYVILPNFLDRDQFARNVRYVEDMSTVYRDIAEFKIEPGGKANLKINRVGDLAGYKHKVWAFQSEFRFILFILPGLPIPSGGIGDPKYALALPDHILNSFTRGTPLSIDHFDVDINPDVLDNCQVTMGPLSTRGDSIIVESLLKKYTKAGTLHPSTLAGSIRAPLR